MAGGLLDLFCPELCKRSLANVDLDMLQSKGINAIILDLDNTLLPWKDSELPEQSTKWVTNALSRGIKLCIGSNTHNPRRLREVACKLGIDAYDRIAKPRRTGLRMAIEKMGATTETTAIIGDQIFTDILGGNRLGILTILVKPMHSREFAGTKVSRFFERFVFRALMRRGMIGTKPFEEASNNQEL